MKLLDVIVIFYFNKEFPVQTLVFIASFKLEWKDELWIFSLQKVSECRKTNSNEFQKHSLVYDVVFITAVEKHESGKVVT